MHADGARVHAFELCERNKLSVWKTEYGRGIVTPNGWLGVPAQRCVAISKDIEVLLRKDAPESLNQG